MHALIAALLEFTSAPITDRDVQLGKNTVINIVVIVYMIMELFIYLFFRPTLLIGSVRHLSCKCSVLYNTYKYSTEGYSFGYSVHGMIF